MPGTSILNWIDTERKGEAHSHTVEAPIIHVMSSCAGVGSDRSTAPAVGSSRLCQVVRVVAQTVQQRPAVGVGA